MRRDTNLLRVLLSGVEGLALRVSKVLLLLHLRRCHGRAGARVAVGRVLQTLGGEGRRHAASAHGLVGHGTVWLRRRLVVGLRLEATATTAVWLEALVAGLGRLAAHVRGAVGLGRHSGARLKFRVSTKWEE